MKKWWQKYGRWCLLSLTIVGCTSIFTLEQQYLIYLETLDYSNRRLQYQYKKSTTADHKIAIIDTTQRHLRRIIIEDLFDFWYGTDWAYSGTTEVPQSGKIACGYFVTTILRDAGFQLERKKLAQQASEKIIKTLIDEKHIQRHRHVKIKEFTEKVDARGDGLYLVGLDTHIGFMVVENGEAAFIHSSRANWQGGVKNEIPTKSKVLIKSKYRIVGKLLPNESVTDKWLRKHFFKTKTK